MFLFSHIRTHPISTLFPYTTLFRSRECRLRGIGLSCSGGGRVDGVPLDGAGHAAGAATAAAQFLAGDGHDLDAVDRKSTRLNSSHRCISYAVFCLKKKKKNK